MKRSYVCPYCFTNNKIHEVKFRCANDTCIEEDKTFSEYWGNRRGAMLPRVVKAPQQNFFARLKMPTTSNCHECNTVTTVRVCPTCHSKLPSTIGDYDDYIIAVIGAKQAGKSHYIAVLIDQIINSIGNTYNCYLKPENDDTIERYNRSFRDPLYKHKTTLDVTRSASNDDRVKQPLLFTLSFSGEGVLGTKVITLAFFDSAGEDLKKEEVMSKHTRYICNSAGIICLLDPLQQAKVRNQISEQQLDVHLPDVDNETDGNDILIRTTNLIRNMLQLKAKKKIQIPMAISFSKIDSIQPLLDPSSKLRQKGRHTDASAFDMVDFHSVHQEMKALVQQWTSGNIPMLLEHNYQHYAYFGLSSLGNDPGREMKVESVEPYRIEDPFLWLLWKNGIIKSVERK
ncbi:TRAFAC clade GTPase domain-containing protein [Bacillus wiedmannii]|uniref:TRAFAC clade GTPase domain-containing protein n=1 Tax=Bacillus wiedmannii TaxID=1890302 RepID=UPI003D998484